MFKYILLLLLLIPLNSFASIAKITALKGEIEVLRSNETFLGVVGFELEKKDRIKTLQHSKAKIRFNDNTLITLGKETTLDIEDYLYEKKNAKFDISVKRGIFKSVTGRIGKIAPKRFTIKTTNATIGIRGTKFICVVTKDVDVCSCIEGSIQVVDRQDHIFVVDKGFSIKVKKAEGAKKVQKIDPKALKKLSKELKVSSKEKKETKESTTTTTAKKATTKKKATKKSVKKVKTTVKKKTTAKVVTKETAATTASTTQSSTTTAQDAEPEQEATPQTATETQDAPVEQTMQEEPVATLQERDIPVDDAVPTMNFEETTTIETPEAPDLAIDTTLTSELVTDVTVQEVATQTTETIIETAEPVVEEPAVSEPVTEEPTVSEPVTEEPAVSEPVTEEPAVSEPVTEEPAVSEPVTEEPAVSEPVTEEPAVAEPVTTTTTTTPTTTPTVTPVVDTNPSGIDVQAVSDTFPENVTNTQNIDPIYFDTVFGYGYWLDSNDQSVDTWISGIATDENTLRDYIGASKTASYQGEILGVQNGTTIKGDISLDFVFGSQTFSGLFNYDTLENVSIENGVIATDGFYANDLIDANSNDVGDLKGRFYGTNVEVVGGDMEINAQHTIFYGVRQ